MAGANKDTIKKCILILIWGITLFGIGFGISFYRNGFCVKGGFKLSFYGGLKMYDLGGLRTDRC